jgi:hypothetical protein
MKNRNVVAVVLLPFVTFGIYSIYWEVVTKNELNAQGAQIPTAWLLIVPFVNIQAVIQDSFNKLGTPEFATAAPGAAMTDQTVAAPTPPTDPTPPAAV